MVAASVGGQLGWLTEVSTSDSAPLFWSVLFWRVQLGDRTAPEYCTYDGRRCLPHFIAQGSSSLRCHLSDPCDGCSRNVCCAAFVSSDVSSGGRNIARTEVVDLYTTSPLAVLASRKNNYFLNEVGTARSLFCSVIRLFVIWLFMTGLVMTICGSIW